MGRDCGVNAEQVSLRHSLQRDRPTGSPQETENGHLNGIKSSSFE